MLLDYASQGFSIKQRALHLILKKKKNQVKDLICYDCLLDIVHVFPKM